MTAVLSAIVAGLLEANIAAAVAILAVILLRQPTRRMLGSRAAYLMWLIVPAAALATLIPERTVEVTGAIMSFGAPARSGAASGAGLDWGAVLLVAAPWVWMAGVLAMAALLGWRQGLFHADMRKGLAGPAVIGFVNQRIVTPDDFAARFNPAERNLILAHETVHLERNDARLNAFVALARCVCWFNPLIHIGAQLMRIDQELSCDAAVVEQRPKARRTYAETLLKTQLASRPLPVGCYWPPAAPHPLTERISMLTRTPLSDRRRLAATAIVLVLAGGAGIAAWAAQPEQKIVTQIADPADELDVVVPFAPIPHADPAPTPAPQQASAVADGTTHPHPGAKFYIPQYPPESILAHEEGTVTVSACVAETGVIESVTLTKSSGFKRLDDATLAGLKGTQMEPATKDGKPVRYCPYTLAVDWKTETPAPAAKPN